MRRLLSDPQIVHEVERLLAEQRQAAQLRLVIDASKVFRNRRLNPPIAHEIERLLAEQPQGAQLQLLLDMSNVTRGRQPIPSSTSAEVSLPTPAPPTWFMFLLACVAQKGRADELLGDAAGEYRKMIVLLGPRLAQWWYRVYVVKVVAVMLPGAVARMWVLHKLFGL
jgi:hypothetical protein